MFRFRNFGKCHVDPALVDRSVEPRLAQACGNIDLRSGIRHNVRRRTRAALASLP